VLAASISAVVGLQATSGSAAPAAKPVSQTSTRPVALDTITDWNIFIREFRQAVTRRDRTALRLMMAKSFLFSLEDEYEGDARDAAFRKWDDPKVKGWQELDRALAKGIRPDPEVPGLLVCPPEWITQHDTYMGYRAGFDRRDGHWRWVWFLSGL
jgi:hypothetical protein